MRVFFKTRKMDTVLNDERSLKKEYGELAQTIKHRLQFMAKVPSLDQVPVSTPFRRHQLAAPKGEYKYAVWIKHPFRIVFEPHHDPVPLLADGGVDLTKVTEITILSIEDYH
jgi:toxin HigB-1